MKKLFLFLLIGMCFCLTATAQFVYTIKADSVLITNDSCTAELNLENSTKNVTGGFLYNKGRGRTEFRKALVKINDSIYLIGTDTLKISAGGLLNLNGLTSPNQIFTTGTSGTDFNISSSATTHTFNLPDASATNRGVLTTGTQTIAGAKTFTSAQTWPSFQTYAVPYISSSKLLLGDSAGFSYNGFDVNVGKDDPSNFRGIYLNGGRASVTANLGTGMRLNVGSGTGGNPNQYDASKGYSFQNRGNVYFRIYTTGSGPLSNDTPFTHNSVFYTNVFPGNNSTYSLGKSSNRWRSFYADTANLGSAGSSIGVLNLSGNTSGTVSIKPGTNAGTWSLTLPSSGGTNGQVLITDGTGISSWGTPSGNTYYKEDGTTLTRRDTLNFGYGVTATDNSGSSRTDVDVNLSNAESFLTSDVSLSTANTFADATSVTLSSGTWLVMGQLTVSANNTDQRVTAKLSDGGTGTVYSSSEASSNKITNSTGYVSISLSAIIQVSASTAVIKTSAASTTSSSTIIATPGDNNSGTTNKATSIRAIKLNNVNNL